jgi:hypothetical protein
MVFSDGLAPAIIEVARRDDFPSFEAFRAAVVALPIAWRGETLTYQGLAGHKLTLHADWSAPPEVNGQPIDYAPARTFDSPFIQSTWADGTVVIQKGERRLVLEFD